MLQRIVDGSSRRPQLVLGDGTQNSIEIDVVKCRRWAIEKAESDLPVACVLDDIVPWEEHLADFVFIDAGAPDETDYAIFCVYQGSRWYTWQGST